MKSICRDAVFALEFEASAPELTQNVVSVGWTVDALRVLKQIRDSAIDEAKKKNEEAFLHLPFAALRARMQIDVDSWVALQDDLNLRSIYIGNDEPSPWGFLASNAPRDDVQRIRNAFVSWTDTALAAFSESRGAYPLGVSNLRRLATEDRIVVASPSRVQIFPWGKPSKSGAPTPFEITSGLLASRLAGRELFPELGPVLQVIGSAERNYSEVMTRPASAAGGKFSLVCGISLETLPGATKPVIYLQFVRRRWADSMYENYSASSSIGAFVMPHAARPNRAYRFSLVRRSGAWDTDLSYPQFEHAFKLKPDFGGDKVVSYLCDDEASVVVMQKAEVTIQRRSELKAGVALVDQADAFERIAAAVSDLGLRPFADFKPVKAANLTTPRLSMLKAEAALSQLLDQYELDDPDSPIDERIEAATTASTSRWFKKGSPKLDPNSGKIVDSIRVLTAGTAFLNDPRRQRLYLVSAIPEDIAWIKTMARTLLGDQFEVISAPLPINTHGPKDSLPEKDSNARQRFASRTREWQRFASAQGIPDHAMVLVQAPMEFEDSEGRRRSDDRVNKIAARRALASLGCTVQYLLPSMPGRLAEFLLRAQAAVLDLVFGHAGSVWGLEQACKACFPASSPKPSWIGAIGSLVVRSNTREPPQSVFVATRLDRTSGQAWVRFAHHDEESMQSEWMRFDEGAKYLSARRIELGSHIKQRELIAEFAASTFDDLVKLDPNAVVFIDSTRIARLATWLSDNGVRDQSRTLAPGIEISARWPTLRVLRIRAQAPIIGRERLHPNANSDGQDVRIWTSVERLFEVGGTSAPTFWSLSRPWSHHKRGASCYRPILLPNSSKDPEKKRTTPFVIYAAAPEDQHMTPRAVEVVILHKQAEDQDVQLASFAQHLRAGMLTARNERWVATPSPLRIIDKLAQYMRM